MSQPQGTETHSDGGDIILTNLNLDTQVATSSNGTTTFYLPDATTLEFPWVWTFKNEGGANSNIILKDNGGNQFSFILKGGVSVKVSLVNMSTTDGVWNSYDAQIIVNGTTDVLTVGSLKYRVYTGSSSSAIQLPDATTLAVDDQYIFLNNCSVPLTLNDGSISNVTYIPPGCLLIAKLTNNSTVGGTWSVTRSPSRFFAEADIASDGTVSWQSSPNVIDTVAKSESLPLYQMNWKNFFFTRGPTVIAILNCSSDGYYTGAPLIPFIVLSSSTACKILWKDPAGGESTYPSVGFRLLIMGE